MTLFAEITDSNGKTKRTRYINPAAVAIVDASGIEHCLLHLVNGKAIELNLPAHKVVAMFNEPASVSPPSSESSDSSH